jgi:hypothetical protein
MAGLVELPLVFVILVLSSHLCSRVHLHFKSCLQAGRLARLIVRVLVRFVFSCRSRSPLRPQSLHLILASPFLVPPVKLRSALAVRFHSYHRHNGLRDFPPEEPVLPSGARRQDQSLSPLTCGVPTCSFVLPRPCCCFLHSSFSCGVQGVRSQLSPRQYISWFQLLFSVGRRFLCRLSPPSIFFTGFRFSCVSWVSAIKTYFSCLRSSILGHPFSCELLQSEAGIILESPDLKTRGFLV